MGILVIIRLLSLVCFANCNSCAVVLVPTWKIDNLTVVICRSIDMKELVSSVNFIRLSA